MGSLVSAFFFCVLTCMQLAYVMYLMASVCCCVCHICFGSASASCFVVLRILIHDEGMQARQ
jgi:hypothetical protein